MEQYYTTNHKRTNNGVHNAKKTNKQFSQQFQEKSFAYDCWVVHHLYGQTGRFTVWELTW